jgi:tRNA (guanine-N7-)-methyltransferase
MPSAPIPAQTNRQAGGREWLPEDYFRVAGVAEIFPERPGAPLEIDLGCGDGSFLADLAATFPERNFLGIERLLGRVRKTCRKVAALANARVLRLESEYAVEWLLPPACAARIHLLFPDPWPKVRHHERRLLRPAFLPHLRRVLAPGGEFLFKTDHEGYAGWAAETAATAADWDLLAWEEGDFYYPLTDFERHWLGQGKTIHRLRLRPRFPAAPGTR